MNAIHLSLILTLVLPLVLYVLFPRRLRWLGTYLRFAFLTAISIVVLAPFYWLICAVFKDQQIMMEYTFLPPPSLWSAETLNFENFRKLFAPRDTMDGRLTFWRHILNSVFLASTATVSQLFFCSLGGFALAKYRFRGKNLFMALMLGTMMVPGILLLAPTYQLMAHLNWIDTYYALLVPVCAHAFGVFLFRQTIIQVPDSIIEAGRIDGCSEFRIYLQLVMPLVRPTCAAFCLLVFLGTWNNFISPQVFIHSVAKLPLPVILNQYVGVYLQEYGIFLAGTFIAIIPPAILFVALQREFISGLTSGAVKG